MCTDDRGQNDQNNQATAAALRARSKKSDSDLVRENEEKFRFCPSEKNMENYWTIFFHSRIIPL